MRQSCHSVCSAGFNLDGQKIITWSSDAKVWNANTGQLLYTLEHQNSWVRFASISPDSSNIITIAEDKTTRIWNAQLWNASNGELLRTLQHNNFAPQAAFSPDSNKVVTASFDHTAKLWDANNGQLLHTLEQKGAHFESAKYSADGNKIVIQLLGSIVKVHEFGPEKE